MRGILGRELCSSEHTMCDNGEAVAIVLILAIFVLLEDWLLYLLVLPFVQLKGLLPNHLLPKEQLKCLLTLK